MSDVTSRWSVAPLSALGELRLGKMLDKSKNHGATAQYLRNINVRWFHFDLSDLQDIRVSDQEREILSVKDGDLFVCEGGEPGRCAVWRDGKNSLVYQKALHRFRSNGTAVPAFLMYLLRHDAEMNLIQSAFSGTTIKHLTRESLSRYSVPVPPLGEQQRIANKLDALLARVDACRDRLDRIPAILKRFRLSVLAAATSGKLTEDWRADTGSFREWQDVRLSDVIVDMRNGLAPKPTESPPGSKILRISAVRAGQLDLADHRYLMVTDKEAELYALKVHDLLFTRYNGTLEFVGVCASLNHVAEGYVYPDKLIRVRADESMAHSKFIEIVFGSELVRRQIENFVKSSAGQKGISGADLKSTRFMLPSLPEQTEIARRVESLFAYADRLEARYAAARAKVAKLTPATLAKAFRGELVPQDPNDEPASVLLERIRARRGEPASKPRRERKKIPNGEFSR